MVDLLLIWTNLPHTHFRVLISCDYNTTLMVSNVQVRVQVQAVMCIHSTRQSQLSGSGIKKVFSESGILQIDKCRYVKSKAVPCRIGHRRGRQWHQ